MKAYSILHCCKLAKFYSLMGPITMSQGKVSRVMYTHRPAVTMSYGTCCQTAHFAVVYVMWFAVN